MRSEPTVVCVLGAPRSGTSLTTRILNLIGVDLGPEDDLTRPVPGVPLWECRQIVELNERILVRLGGEGLDPPVPEPGWERSQEFAAERSEAEELLSSKFGGSRLWGWKDPRTCVTLPFWRQIAPAMRYVICLRNPLDATDSVLRWVQIPRRQALRTWLTYAASALANSAGEPRALVSYEQYFAGGGRRQVERLARFAGRPLPAAGSAEKGELDRLIDEGEWHHRARAAGALGDPDLLPAMTPLYLLQELLRAAECGAPQGAEPLIPDSLSRTVDLYAERLLTATTAA